MIPRRLPSDARFELTKKYRKAQRKPPLKRVSSGKDKMHHSSPRLFFPFRLFPVPRPPVLPPRPFTKNLVVLSSAMGSRSFLAAAYTSNARETRVKRESVGNVEEAKDEGRAERQNGCEERRRKIFRSITHPRHRIYLPSPCARATFFFVLFMLES